MTQSGEVNFWECDGGGWSGGREWVHRGKGDPPEAKRRPTHSPQCSKTFPYLLSHVFRTKTLRCSSHLITQREKTRVRKASNLLNLSLPVTEVPGLLRGR